MEKDKILSAQPSLKKNIVKIFKIGLIFLIFIAVCAVYFNKPKTENSLYLGPKMAKISMNGFIVNAEVADTPESREQGLSGKNKLDEGGGMWFVFQSDGNYGFWMKEMNFPLDIIWFDENLKIVSLQKNLSPETYPTVFYPGSNSRYVLEVNAGFAEKSKIKIGDRAEVLPK